MDHDRYIEQAEQEGQSIIKRFFFDRARPDVPMSWREMLAAWKEPDFAAFFSACLARAPWPAFFWETPAFAEAILASPFECVTVDAPGLYRAKADIAPFRGNIDAAGGRTVIAFPSLRGDAVLVVPTDGVPATDYAHLAAFLRTATTGELVELWKQVAVSVEASVDAASWHWLSTSGLGVSWLHVRIDTRPKYYSYDAYRWAAD